MSEGLTMFTPAGYIAYDPVDIIPNEYSQENFEKILNKLGSYEDAEEEGRLIELPCALGDTVYTNHSMQGWYMHRKNRPYEAKVVFIGINGVDNSMNVELGEGKMLQFRFSDIGKKVFLTKSEAEAALKECEKE